MSELSRRVDDYKVRLGDATLREPFLPVLVLGPPRTGKTTLVASPILSEWPGPSIVTSVRSDIATHTLEARQATDSRVYLFDPSGLIRKTLPDSVDVVGFDPLEFTAEWDGAVRMSEAMKEAGHLGAVQDGSFWYETAAQLLAPLLYAAARSNGYEMSDVYRWVKTQNDFEVRALLDATENADAQSAFEAARQREVLVRESIYATLESMLGAYSTRQAQHLSLENPISPEKFFDPEQSGHSPTLFLCAPPSAQAEYRPMFITMVKYFMDFVYERNRSAPPVWDEDGFETWLGGAGGVPRGGHPGVPLLLMLDEAGNVASLRSFEVLVSTAAGSGIQLVSVFHDLSQMSAIYGEAKAMSAFNNHSVVVILPGMRDPQVTRILGDELEEPQLEGVSLRTIPTGHAVLLNENTTARVIDLR